MTVGDLYQRMGTTSFPLEPGSATSFTFVDTARDRLLALFAAAINAEFGAAWTQVVATLPAASKFQGTQPVQDTIALPPNPAVLLQRKCEFPLLAFHRTGSATNDQYLLDSSQRIQDWELHYVLGPTNIEGLRKLLDFPVALFGLIAGVIRQRGHSAYEDGALQFFPGTGGLSSVALVSQLGPGQAAFGGDESGTLYWLTTFTLRTTEPIYDDHSGLATFEAVDTDTNAGNFTVSTSSDSPLQYG